MVYARKMYAKYRCNGRFFGRRVNCEQVPQLPAWIVARALDDPRKIPYLLVWQNRSQGMVQEAVRIVRHHETPYMGGLDWTDAVEIKRTDGTRNFIRTVLRPLPRNGGRARLLICPYCDTPRRGLYGWEPGGKYTNSARTCAWKCCTCAGLHHESEGGALVHHNRRGAFFRLVEATYGPVRSDRTEAWLPYFFTSPQQAHDVGVC
jgi:hypothetical protein